MLPVDLKLPLFLTSVTLLQAFTLLTVALVAVPLIRLVRQLIRPYISPLRHLRGPESGFFFGHLTDMRKFDSGVWHEQMLENYGPVLKIKEFLGVCIFQAALFIPLALLSYTPHCMLIDADVLYLVRFERETNFSLWIQKQLTISWATR
jgi:hypothetical protein